MKWLGPCVESSASATVIREGAGLRYSLYKWPGAGLTVKTRVGVGEFRFREAGWAGAAAQRPPAHHFL